MQTVQGEASVHEHGGPSTAMASGNASAGGGPSARWPREGASHARAHNETDHNRQHAMSADCKCASEQDC
eukprot:10689745-Alexandrium_andersonii.AAC.1